MGCGAQDASGQGAERLTPVGLSSNDDDAACRQTLSAKAAYLIDHRGAVLHRAAAASPAITGPNAQPSVSGRAANSPPTPQEG
jgi:hypothetical protein